MFGFAAATTASTGKTAPSSGFLAGTPASGPGGFGSFGGAGAGGFGATTGTGGFGATTGTGGFGATTGTGGFGATTGTGGFGATTGTGGFGATTGTGGFGATTGTGGFGATTGTGGFGATTGTGGFGATTGTGGFGATTGTGGFGATTGTGGFGATTGTGGFGATTGTGGFGATTGTGGFGGFGAAKGFGSATATGGQVQVPPYKGIKGPGFSSDWLRSINFSTLRDDILFEELPPSLQQHLMELHNFIQAEHDAKRFVEASLTDSMGTNPGGSPSYRELKKKLGQLTAGENAVDAIRVDCFEREVHAQHLGLLLENCEEEVVQYSKRVWEPLAEQDFTQRRSGNRSEPPSEPFLRSLRDIQARMEDISAAVTELELAVLPNTQRQKRTTTADNNVVSTTTETLPSSSLFYRHTGEMNPMETTTGLRSTVVSHPVLQMNTTFSNELTILLNLAEWTSRLHARADAARDRFAYLYGASEAELLLAQQHRQLPTGAKRPFPLRSTEVSLLPEVNHDTIGDIHRRSVGLDRLGALGNGERRMQYDVLLERQRQTTTPAPVGATNTAFVAPAANTTTLGTAGTAASTGPGMTASTVTSAVPPPSSAGTAATGASGFGMPAPTASGTGDTATSGGTAATAGNDRTLQRKGCA